MANSATYLDYLGEKTLVNNFFQINTEIKASIKLREKTLAIGHQFAKFANVFSRQCFALYSSYVTTLEIGNFIYCITKYILYCNVMATVCHLRHAAPYTNIRTIIMQLLCINSNLSVLHIQSIMIYDIVRRIILNLYRTCILHTMICSDF